MLALRRWNREHRCPECGGPKADCHVPQNEFVATWRGDLKVCQIAYVLQRRMKEFHALEERGYDVQPEGTYPVLVPRKP